MGSAFYALSAVHKITPAVAQLQHWLSQHPSAKAYWVGGCLRHVLADHAAGQSERDLYRLQRTIDDYDLTLIGACPRALSQALANALNAHWVPLDEAWGIYRLILTHAPFQNVSIDIAAALGDDIYTDLARRDLTINAMALRLELVEGTTPDFSDFKDFPGFIDPYNGLADLRARKIRMLSEANLKDDPLRLLRVFRMGAAIDATDYDPQTIEVVRRYAPRLSQSAPERQQLEFFKLLSRPDSFKHLQAMADAGLLEVVLPELTPCRAVPANTHHHLPLWDHTLEVARQCEVMFSSLPANTQAELLTPLGAPQSPLSRLGAVKFAALMHDVGKPDTMALLENGRYTFYGHEAVSETLSEQACARLKAANAVTQQLKRLTRWHLYPCAFSPASSQKSVLRFLRRIGEATPDLMLLAMADRMATKGPAVLPQDLTEAIAHHRWLLAQHYAYKPVLSQPRLLDGQAVMQLLGLKPGKQVGEWLARLQEAQQLGEIQTPEAAQAWLISQA
ncbi:MAG: HD domain-containing protein [Vampirovibrionales bacterium]|nr:HD domain-containing protein [Vampirovibrionales bacterium]